MFYNSNTIRACIDVDPSILFLKKKKTKIYFNKNNFQ